MTKVTCSECGKEAEVPFKPREGTPVYCKDCYLKRKGITPRSESGQGSLKEPVEEAEELAEEVVEETAETEEAEETEEKAA
jgi:CxxC-x17-CxxC domain-containing protein